MHTTNAYSCPHPTVKVKALADIRPIAIDDADSIIRTYHLNLHSQTEQPLLPNMSAEETRKFEKAEKAIAGEPEKRRLDEVAEAQAADVPSAKKAKVQAL